MKRDIAFLMDYKGQFYCPFHGTDQSMDLALLARRLEALGWSMTAMPFSAVDFADDGWKGRPFLYQSSQDQGLLYKSFIEDVVLGLHLKGAVPVPRFELLRAHHNKCFMEILRTASGLAEMTGLASRAYGNLRDFERDLDNLAFPMVIKAAAGDTGRAVGLARDRREALKLARRYAFTPDARTVWKNLANRAKGQRRNSDTFYRGKFIVQPFIPGADADHRVHYFGDRWFVVRRDNRPGDFRASGSPIPRTWPENPPEGIIDFLRPIVDVFDVPFASLDVLHDGERFYLLEFQFLRFGIKSLVRSPWYFTIGTDGRPVRHDGKSELEALFAHALARYLEARV